MTYITGTCGIFGGPTDTEEEGNEWSDPSAEPLSLLTHDDVDEPRWAHLFLPEQPPGTTGLARRLNPLSNYIACQWRYDRHPRSWLRDTYVKVTNQETGAFIELVQPVDWGPKPDLPNKRVIDVSPGLARRLQIIPGVTRVRVDVPDPPWLGKPPGIDIVPVPQPVTPNESEMPQMVNRVGAIVAMVLWNMARSLWLPLCAYVVELVDEAENEFKTGEGPLKKVYVLERIEPWLVDHLADVPEGPFHMFHKLIRAVVPFLVDAILSLLNGFVAKDWSDQVDSWLKALGKALGIY